MSRIEESRDDDSIMIGRAELPQLKKGMLLKPSKPRVQPAQE